MNPTIEDEILPWIFPHIDALLSNEPLQTLLDRYCQDVCDLTGFSKATVISITSGAEAVGICNIPEEIRSVVKEDLSNKKPSIELNPTESVLKKRQMKRMRVVFFPEEGDISFPQSVLSFDYAPQGTWQPKDVLFLLLYSLEGEFLGSVRLTEPIDHNRPDFDDANIVQALNEVAIAGGRLIDYFLKWQRLRGSEMLFTYALDCFSIPVMLINDKGQLFRANHSINELCLQHHLKPNDFVKLLKAQNHQLWEIHTKKSVQTQMKLQVKPINAKVPFFFDVIAKPLIPNSNFATLLEFHIPQVEKTETRDERKETQIVNEIHEEPGTPPKELQVEEPQVELQKSFIQTKLSEDQIPALISISGEIAQQLSVISGNVELMKMYSEDESQLPLIDKIMVAVENINSQLLKIRELDKKEEPAEVTDQDPPKQPVGILCVEDEPHILELLSEIVKRCGEEVITAEDGKKAWEMIQEGVYPKMIISDVKMPHMDGFELLRHIRTVDIKTPVILISGFWSEDTIQEARKLGVTDFMAKPFPVGKLMKHIKSITIKEVD